MRTWTRNCLKCGKQFTTHVPNQKYCSFECRDYKRKQLIKHRKEYGIYAVKKAEVERLRNQKYLEIQGINDYG